MNQKDFIKEVYIKNLFGYYTYKVPSDKGDIFSQLMIVYGDNGSGKTTLLELVFTLLSLSIEGRFRPSFYKLFELKYDEISITLSNNIKITAFKDTSIKSKFKFILYVFEDEIPVFQIPFRGAITKKGTMKEFWNNETLFELSSFMRQMNISVFFVSDNRKFSYSGGHDDTYIDDESNYKYMKELDYQRMKGEITSYDYAVLKNKKTSRGSEKLLAPAIQRLENWIRRKALIGSRQGEKSTNTIYKEIVKRITKSRIKDIPLEEKVRLIENELQDISRKSEEYSKFGLISAIELQEIIVAISNAKGAKLEILYNAIEPYIKGLNANLNSLKEVQELILSFIENINSYLTHKQVFYHLSTGFKIVHQGTNQEIPFSSLSSGEKQLILLICNVITASEEATIFIIDEPEISLNVKWQRKLLDTLLYLGLNRNIQFIIATHSIQLLTGHSENVTKLINLQAQN